MLRFGIVRINDEGRVSVELVGFDPSSETHWNLVRDYGTPEIWVQVARRAYEGELAASRLALARGWLEEAERARAATTCRASEVARRLRTFLERIREALDWKESP